MIKNDELLFVVNENNEPLRPLTRKEVHAKKIWHRNTYIWIFNPKKQILCQKRSLLKDTGPGMWEPFFGGHVAAGEEYMQSALKELSEELGIDAEHDQLNLFKIYKSNDYTEFIALITFKWNGDIASIELEKEEVDMIEWFDINEIKRILLEDHDSHWNNIGYESEILEFITDLHSSEEKNL